MTSSSTKVSPSKVGRLPAAPPAVAEAHSLARRTFEADVSDVHADLEAGTADFVLVDSHGLDAWSQEMLGGYEYWVREVDALTAAGVVCDC